MKCNNIEKPNCLVVLLSFESSASFDICSGAFLVEMSTHTFQTLLWQADWAFRKEAPCLLKTNPGSLISAVALPLPSEHWGWIFCFKSCGHGKAILLGTQSLATAAVSERTSGPAHPARHLYCAAGKLNGAN